MSSSTNRTTLIVAVGPRACAIPLAHVEETLRPLFVAAVAGTPSFVRGVSIIRGSAVPVIDLHALLHAGLPSATQGRFVVLKFGVHRVAVGVDAVVGLRELGPAQLSELPSLLRDADTELTEAVGVCDAQLLFVLRAARLVPAGVWASLEQETRG